MKRELQALGTQPIQKAIDTGKQIFENIVEGVQTRTGLATERAQQNIQMAKETIETAKEIYKEGLRPESKIKEGKIEEGTSGPSSIESGKSEEKWHAKWDVKHFPEVSAPVAETLEDVSRLEEEERQRRMQTSLGLECQEKIQQIQNELRTTQITPK